MAGAGFGVLDRHEDYDVPERDAAFWAGRTGKAWIERVCDDDAGLGGLDLPIRCYRERSVSGEI